MLTIAIRTTRNALTLPHRLVVRALCVAAITTHGCMWLATAYILGVASNAHAQGSNGTLVPQENISISLPVYVSSLIGTAVFTWMIAQHDRKNDKRVDEVTAEVEKRLSGEIDDLKATLNKLLRRLGSKDITDS